MYCGDGINDLTALGAADVGMAVGSSEASAAATLADRKASIAGQSPQLRGLMRGLVRGLA
jgi:P-type E1-E2 ATPase